MDLRRFVLTITLPSALFLTFLRVSLELRYLPVVVVVFTACVVMLLCGSDPDAGASACARRTRGRS